MSPRKLSEMKSELEKMLASELYNAMDPQLIAMRDRARKLTREFNDSAVEAKEMRLKIAKELLGSTGEKIYIEAPFRCDYGSNIFAGNELYMNFGCVILDCAEVHIGESVLFGPGVQIYTATHPLDAALRATGAEFAKPIRIGNRVWIGGNTVVCPGVTIGDNTTIGAGSVVTKDIPAGVLAAGNPCRVIREL